MNNNETQLRMEALERRLVALEATVRAEATTGRGDESTDAQHAFTDIVGVRGVTVENVGGTAVVNCDETRPMPFDVDIRDVDVEHEGETTTERHIMLYLGGSNGVSVLDQNGNSPIPVDQANCPELYQAVFNGDKWFDTGEKPPVSGFGHYEVWLYIADSKDWSSKSTTSPSFSWGLDVFGNNTPDTVVYAIKIANIRRVGVWQGNSNLEIKQLFHGNFTLPGHGLNWKPLRLFHEYKESDDAPSEWLPENGDSLRAVTAIQRNGSDIQVKYTEVSATSDGRLLFGLESDWYTI